MRRGGGHSCCRMRQAQVEDGLQNPHPTVLMLAAFVVTTGVWAALAAIGETHGDSGGVPILDLRRFTQGNPAEQAAVAREVDAACREIGFLVIVRHGIAEKILRRGWREIAKFFDLSAEDKALAPQMTADYHYGYSALEGETLSVGAGEEDHVPDLKEMFSTGPYDSASGIAAPRYPSKPRSFRSAWHEYYMAMEALSAQLLRLFARALGIQDDYFAKLSNRHACSLRAINYPSLESIGDAARGRLRASAHTDYGTLTILRSGGPGLQVRNRSSGAWVDVPYIQRSHFIINLGDLMSRWTNDRWVSTPHRVVFTNHTAGGHARTFGRIFGGRRQSPYARRQAVAFFHNLNPDANVSVIDTCIEPGQTAKYPPILAMDHLIQKHLASTQPNRRTRAPDIPSGNQPEKDMTCQTLR